MYGAQEKLAVAGNGHGIYDNWFAYRNMASLEDSYSLALLLQGGSANNAARLNDHQPVHIQ
jgi:fructose/tagatose bisphosphate aldolase